MKLSLLKNIIENTFNKKEKINNKYNYFRAYTAVDQTINMLNSGELRIAEQKNNRWITYNWVKKAILLFFFMKKNKIIHISGNKFYDKIPFKYSEYDEKKFKRENIRIVPPAMIRYGAFIAKNCIIMPSFINIGAYIDKGTMIDTWATIGSCAQIGKNVHISGNVGIGGMLEPAQSAPTIIEDNCFIGARSEIVEGVIVKKNSVISMGVYIGQSTKIFDVQTGKIHYGYIPENSVVISGSLPSVNKKYSVYCAIIIKKVDSKTVDKTSINKSLRENIKFD